MKQVRQQEILALIKKEGYFSTEALAAHFDVSTQTIRRDLDSLEQQGLVDKMYGGATLVGSTTPENGSSFFTYIPPTDHEEEKELIAAKAMEFVEDGMTLALDIGSTTRVLWPELHKKNNLTIITQDMLLASELFEHPTNRVYLLGGFLGASGTTSGMYVNEFLDTISKIDVFFLSTDGITVNEGFTCDYTGVGSLRSAVLARANVKIALADSTKFGHTGFYRTCGLTDVDHIITDAGVDPAFIKEIQAQKVNIHIAE